MMRPVAALWLAALGLLGSWSPGAGRAIRQGDAAIGQGLLNPAADWYVRPAATGHLAIEWRARRDPPPPIVGSLPASAAALPPASAPPSDRQTELYDPVVPAPDGGPPRFPTGPPPLA